MAYLLKSIDLPQRFFTRAHVTMLSDRSADDAMFRKWYFHTSFIVLFARRDFHGTQRTYQLY